MRILELEGMAYLDKPEGLSYLMGPLIAKSAEEQVLFRKAFEQYLLEIRKAPKYTQLDAYWSWRIPPRLLTYIVLSILIIGILPLLLISPSFTITPSSQIQVTYGAPIELGLTYNDYFSTSVPVVDWSLQSEEGDTITTSRQEKGVSFIYEQSYFRGSPRQYIHLSVSHPRTEKVFLKQIIEVLVECPTPPELGRIQISPPDPSPGEQIRFSAEIEDTSNLNLSYTWNFGAKGPSSSQQITPYFSFDTTGSYQVTLTVQDTSASEYCTKTISLPIVIKEGDEEYDDLHMKKLRMGEEKHLAYLHPIIWFTIILAAILLWVNWFLKFRNRQEDKVQQELTKEVDTLPKSKRHGPYSIPFPTQEQNIPIPEAHAQLANSMRLRQQGNHYQLDIPKTLKQTIKKGGFISPIFRHGTQASDYVILIDRASKIGHQGNLFQYLVSQLRGQEVYLEVLYYQGDLNRLWSADLKEIQTLETLQLRFPNHRLIILGDGHSLLDTYSRQPKLKETLHQALTQWSSRLLLSPIAPVAWTYKEYLLNKDLPIFPADLQGLETAARYIEGQQSPEDLPADFWTWQGGLADERKDENSNFIDWDDFEELEEYFESQPDLWLWLRALAVFPEPNWRLTIAIGKALEPLKVTLGYDQLLQLSRISWLRNGQLDHDLRMELLEHLHHHNPQAKQLARQAVKEQLESVKEPLAGSHAEQEMVSQLALQTHALKPEDTNAKKELIRLLDENHLPPQLIAELQHMRGWKLGLAQNVAEKSSPEDLKSFLQPQETDTSTWERLLADLPLIQAILGSLLLLTISIIMIAREGKPLSDGEEAISFPYQTKESDLEAAYYNNLAIETFQEQVYPKIDSLSRLDLSSDQVRNQSIADWWEDINSYITQALTIDPTYELARQNLSYMRYNSRVGIFNNLKKFDTEIDSSWLIRSTLQALQHDSIVQDAAHALGLIHYYLDRIDSAYYYYEQLIGNPFLDTLTITPNLSHFLPAPPPIEEVLLENDNNRPAMQDSIKHQILEVKGILLHYFDSRAGVHSHRDFYNKTDSKTSQHYIVDDTDILRIIPESEVAFHTDLSGNAAIANSLGVGDVPLNNSTLGIKLCAAANGDYSNMLQNTQRLLAYLLTKHQLTVDQIIADPAFLNRSEWERFKIEIKTIIDPHSLQAGSTYCINDQFDVISVRNRPLSLSELRIINQGRNNPQYNPLNKETLIAYLNRGDQVIFLEELVDFYKIRFQRSNGGLSEAYISKSYQQKSTLSICPKSPNNLRDGNTYCIGSANFGIALRNRILSPDELSTINRGGDGPEYRALNDQTLISRLPNGTKVVLEQQLADAFRVRTLNTFNGEFLAGYIVNRNQNASTLLTCQSAPSTSTLNSGTINGSSITAYRMAINDIEEAMTLQDIFTNPQKSGLTNSIATERQGIIDSLYRTGLQRLEEVLPELSDNQLTNLGQLGKAYSYYSFAQWKQGQHQAALGNVSRALAGFSKDASYRNQDLAIAQALTGLIGIDRLYDSLQVASDSLYLWTDKAADATRDEAKAMFVFGKRFYDKFALRSNKLQPPNLYNTFEIINTAKSTASNINDEGIKNGLKSYLLQSQLAGLKNCYDLIFHIDNVSKISGHQQNDEQVKTIINQWRTDYEVEKTSLLQELRELLGPDHPTYFYWDMRL